MLKQPLATSEPAVCLTRVFSAPRERVFRAWTDALSLEYWFGPPGYKARVIRLDARTGGEYDIAMQPPGNDSVPRRIVGKYREVSAPQRLVFTWSRVDAKGVPLDDSESLVTIEFASVPDGTEVRLTHEYLATPESREAHLAGWRGTFERFQASLADRMRNMSA